eukprot:s2274_g5.t2
MEAAAGQGQVEAVEEILRQAGGRMSSWILNRALFLACCFRGGKAEMIHRLIEMRADANRPYPFKGFSFNAAFLVAKSLQHRFGKVTNISKMSYHSWGARPLIAAILSAQYEGAAALIAEGARLDLPNKRGCTAIDLAQGQDLPFFMTEALEGRLGECKQVAKAALEHSYFEARKKASPTEEALQELDVDKSGKVEQTELESFARSKGMSPEQIHQEFLSLDLNGDGVLEADEIRRTLDASAAADAAPSVADSSAVSASLGQAVALPALPAEASLVPPKAGSSLVPPPPKASVQVPEQSPDIQAAAPTADVQEDLAVRAQRGAERAVAEMFEKKAAEALAAMHEDTSNAEKLEKTARTLRGQARQLEMQVTSKVAEAAKVATDSVVSKALRQVKMMSQEVASAEEEARRSQNLADQAMEQAVTAQSKISAEVQRIKAERSSFPRVRNAAVALAGVVFAALGAEALQPVLEQLRPAKQALLKSKFQELEDDQHPPEDVDGEDGEARPDLDGFLICSAAVRVFEFEFRQRVLLNASIATFLSSMVLLISFSAILIFANCGTVLMFGTVATTSRLKKERTGQWTKTPRFCVESPSGITMTCLPVECAAQTGKSLQRMSSADEDSSLAIDVLLICSNPYHLAGQPMLQACLGQTCKSLRAAISQPGYGRACLEHFADASPWVAFAVERNLLGRPSLENIQSWISVQQQLTFEAFEMNASW